MFIENVGALLHKKKSCRRVFSYITEARFFTMLVLRLGAGPGMLQECEKRDLVLFWCSFCLKHVGLEVLPPALQTRQPGKNQFSPPLARLADVEFSSWRPRCARSRSTFRCGWSLECFCSCCSY